MPTPSPIRSHRHVLTAVFAGLSMALLVILVHQKLMGYDQDGCFAPTWSTLDSSEDGLTLRKRMGRCKLEVGLEGEVRWNEAEDGIEWLEPGGRLDVEHRLADARHRLKVRSGAAGTPKMTYWRQGEERPLDEEGREWLHGVALELFRRAGLDAEGRSARILARSGVEGLLAEMDEIGSDHVAALYARTAFDRPVGELGRVLHSVARSTGSDGVAAQVLVDLAEHGLPQEGDGERLHRAVGEVLETVGSDHEMGRAVIAFLEHPPSGAPMREDLEETLLRRAAEGLGSDYEAARVVAVYAEEAEPGAPLPPALFELLHTIGSDYEMRQSLVALLATQPGAGDLERILQTSRQIGSDFDQAEALIAVAKAGRASPELDRAYRQALEGIGSDFERRRVAEAWP